MNGKGVHEGRREEIAAYMLGALSPGEAAELERHLAECAECRAYVGSVRPVVDLIPESVERFEAPPRLRAAILEQVHAEAGLPAPASERSPLFPGRRGLRSLRPILVAGVAALMLAAVAGYAIRGGDSVNGGLSTVATSGRPPGVTAEVTREGSSGTLALANVSDLPEGKVLEAWVQRDGKIAPAGDLFIPDEEGDAVATIEDMSRVEAVMVTAEPRGGSEAPTSTPIVTLTMG